MRLSYLLSLHLPPLRLSKPASDERRRQSIRTSNCSCPQRFRDDFAPTHTHRNTRLCTRPGFFFFPPQGCFTPVRALPFGLADVDENDRNRGKRVMWAARFIASCHGNRRNDRENDSHGRIRGSGEKTTIITWQNRNCFSIFGANIISKGNSKGESVILQ